MIAAMKYGTLALAMTLSMALPGQANDGRVALRTVHVESPDNWTLRQPQSVSPYGKGYEKQNGIYVCDAGSDAKGTMGVVQTYQLNQTEPVAVVASCQSKADAVGGNIDSGYSLYVDVTYADGTSLWAQTYHFPVGTAAWSEGCVVITPDKPIRTLCVYGLFRGHSGKASFRNLELRAFSSKSATCSYAGAVVQEKREKGSEAALLLRDVAADGDFVCVDAAKAAASGATVEDIRVSTSVGRLPSGTDEVVIRLHDLTSSDRALTVVYSIPLPEVKGEWYWHEGPRSSVPLGERGEKTTVRSVREAGMGKLSQWPLGVVSASSTTGKELGAFGVAVNPDYPAFYHIACNAGLQQLYVSFDIALTPEVPEVELHVVPLFWRLGDDPLGVTAVPSLQPLTSNVPAGSNAFRAALDAWRRAFPSHCAVRAVEQGNWMAFANISDIDRWEDFGFRFKEGNSEVARDDAAGLTTFRYTEPMTWWQSIETTKASTPVIDKAMQQALSVAKRNTRDKQGNPQRLVPESQALLTTGFFDRDGHPYGQQVQMPWCTGVVWSMNDAPGLVALAHDGKLSDAHNKGVPAVAGFEVKWNDALADTYYGPVRNPSLLPRTRQELAAAQHQPGLDGEYIDSSEGYVTARLDYRRAHFAGMATPLTFDSQTLQPCILRELIAFEYVRKIADDVHARGKLAMANSTPSCCFWLAPQLDVLGTETDWHRGGQWTPMADDELLYRRAMCFGKPYCFLMNSDFTTFSHADTERYMRRAAAYGMFPSFFSANASSDHYFQNPDLYERDRSLFKKYLPVIKQVAESGWEPQTGVTSDREHIYVERFGALKGSVVTSSGNTEGSVIYLTVFNDSDAPSDFVLTLSAELQRQMKETKSHAVELLSGKTLSLRRGKLSGTLPAQDVYIIAFR